MTRHSAQAGLGPQPEARGQPGAATSMKQAMAMSSARGNLFKNSAFLISSMARSFPCREICRVERLRRTGPM
jgi:hypothetical protein